LEHAIKGEAVDQEWSIPKDELGFEFMMNALRLIDGFELDLFEQRTGLSPMLINNKLKKAQEKGLIEQKRSPENRILIKPTLLGQRFLNELLQLFLE
jgi:oxygen-independent coproporphyrinogen-3 oxidase